MYAVLLPEFGERAIVIVGLYGSPELFAMSYLQLSVREHCDEINNRFSYILAWFQCFVCGVLKPVSVSRCHINYRCIIIVIITGCLSSNFEPFRRKNVHLTQEQELALNLFRAWILDRLPTTSALSWVFTVTPHRWLRLLRRPGMLC